MFSVLRADTSSTPATVIDPAFGLVVAVNAAGEVIWYYQTDRSYAYVDVLASGNLRLVSAMGRYLEIDLLGNVVAAWRSERLFADRAFVPSARIVPVVIDDVLHRNGVQLTNGNVLMLATEVQRVGSAYPFSRTAQEVEPAYTMPEPAQRVADLIVELSPAGKTVQRWRLLDLLDPKRLAAGSDRRVENALYPADDTGLPYHWSYASGLAYDAKTDTLIVSLWNQAAIVGINKTQKTLKWLFADPEAGWRKPWADYLLSPKAGNAAQFIWPQQVSSPQLTAAGTLLVFDHGVNSGHSGQAFSRLVEYRIDAAKGEVEQRWQYRGAGFYDSQTGGLTRSDNWLTITRSKKGKASVLNGAIIEQFAGTTTATQPVLSLDVGNSGWAVRNATRVNHLQAPALSKSALMVMQNTGFERPAVAALAPQKALAENWDKVRTTGVPVAVDGDWLIEVATPGGIYSEKLSVEQQQGQLAVGHLGDYPVLAVIRGEQMTFTRRRQALSGTLTYRYKGVIRNGLEAEGTFSISNADNKVIARGLTWRGYKQ